jgi:hypothetical protein
MLAIGSTNLIVKDCMLWMLTLDPVEPLGESGGSSVRKGGKTDVESRDIQGGSPHSCRLRTDVLPPMSKY